MLSRIKNIGPGPFIAAAFIGPGTVTICSIAGVTYGMQLLWAMVFSTIATLVLQMMAARIGLATKTGLAQNIKDYFSHNQALKILAIILILSAILIGNAAYEAGNIGGAVLGLELLLEKSNAYYPLLIGAGLVLLLWFGNYQFLEKLFILLVILMSLAFIYGAIASKPDINQLISGLCIPRLPKNSFIIALGLIGTTIVPYNLFLHASLVNEKWHGEKDLNALKTDTRIAILLGGLISLAIIICAAMSGLTSVSNAADLAAGLENVLGQTGNTIVGVGLLAAGFTSALAAPLATAYVASEIFEWNKKEFKFKLIWLFIILLGVVVNLSGIKPTVIIKFAQLANGLLLPIIALFLLLAINRKSIPEVFRNSIWQNIIGSIVILITLALSVKTLISLFS